MTPKVTREGLARLLYAMDGTGINFTKIVLGNGDLQPDSMGMTNLMNPLETVELTGITLEENYAVLDAVFSNTNTQDSFQWTEVGIFCSNPDSTEEQPLDDILYAYGHYRMGDDDTATVVIPKAGTEIFEIRLTYRIYVGELDNITASLAASANYVTHEELEAHAGESNPHGTTAEDVGLGEVENVSTNNQKPTYTLPDTMEELKSGETLSAAMGKLARAVKNLIAHLKDDVAHITKAEREKWDAKAEGEHSHKTSEINSGTLGVARGGTGASSLASGKALVGNGTGAVSMRDITNNTSTANGIAGSTNLVTMNTLKNALNRTTSVAAADANYSTIMARGIKAGTGDITSVSSSMPNGTIYLQYS